MLRSLTLPDGNFIKPGTILGDVLEYNAARSTITSKLAQANDVPPETTKGDGMYNKERFFVEKFH
jgi:hypothetical protein